ncbi:ACT domain-containing protein ACR3 isoform X1 [Ananas comosus]|uniref:ACT domain-containing protein ACR n=2 Tax=Ananas comosus TaxID=4615 RepID=A0A6P5GSZ0_ANACO|nr:ACT domain-containing protein ACR3 isoform X1 [Ananas comosus]
MWPYFDPEYENLSLHINPPRVCIDNTACDECTLVKVDSMNKTGILLEVVQVLSDLDLAISKAYITSDGGWFMDVFHVTDQHGRKITDPQTIEYIEKALGPESNIFGPKGDSSPGRLVGMRSIGDHTAVELIGTDRPGLLSEIFAVLANLHCNIIAAEVWTHRMRVACVLYINDEATGRAVDDSERLSVMKEQLRNVLAGRGDDARGGRTNFSVGSTHVDRRLHQLMRADEDYGSDGGLTEGTDSDLVSRPVVTVENCGEKAYSVVTVRCKDRSKLLFDIVCTLTDMLYVVFHASISSDGVYALQELYIRRNDDRTLDSKDERERVIKCIEAAILRRVSEGFSLEICGRDRVGLLSDVTRVLREHGLSVMRADVTTVGEQAVDVFYVCDPSGTPVDTRAIEALRREIGHTVMLNAKKVAAPSPSDPANASFFSFGSFFGKLLPNI